MVTAETVWFTNERVRLTNVVVSPQHHYTVPVHNPTLLWFVGAGLWRIDTPGPAPTIRPPPVPVPIPDKTVKYYANASAIATANSFSAGVGAALLTAWLDVRCDARRVWQLERGNGWLPSRGDMVAG